MALATPALIGDGQWPIVRIAPWAVNNNEDDASASVELKATPGAGRALYVTHVSMSKIASQADLGLVLLDGDGTYLYGPIYLVDNGAGNFKKDWEIPLKLTDNKSLCVIDIVGKGAVEFTIYVEGFTGTAPIV